MKKSVALAYYNGGRFIKEQLDSILKQLGDGDEVIISVDSAADGSEELLKELADRDDRIVLVPGPAQGVVKNFENAIVKCNGDIIFLSDQDDIWMDDKVVTMMKYFEQESVTAILHNAALVDGEGRQQSGDLFSMRKSNTGILKNLIKNSYVGCCMAFRKELIPVICPIPDRMYMHDYWIGTMAELHGGVGLIRQPLIKYRRHGDNVTEMSHGSLLFMMKKRADIIACLLKHYRGHHHSE